MLLIVDFAVPLRIQTLICDPRCSLVCSLRFGTKLHGILGLTPVWNFYTDVTLMLD
jgi:hypothetical protein